jgi:hypothetical protein
MQVDPLTGKVMMHQFISLDTDRYYRSYFFVYVEVKSVYSFMSRVVTVGTKYPINSHNNSNSNLGPMSRGLPPYVVYISYTVIHLILTP